MHIDRWTLALQTLNILILVWLLTRFLYRPVMDAILARQAAANAILADAQAIKDAAVAEEAGLRARDAAYEQEAARRRTTLETEMASERRHMLEQAGAEAADLARRAATEAEAEGARMAVALQQKAVELAGTMAETLLGRVPLAAVGSAMSDALLDRIATLEDGERAALAGDASLSVITAAPLDDATRARLVESFRTALGRADAPRFETDPRLIAGTELRGTHIVIRNSWRADLDTLLAAAREHGDVERGG